MADSWGVFPFRLGLVTVAMCAILGAVGQGGPVPTGRMIYKLNYTLLSNLKQCII